MLEQAKKFQKHNVEQMMDEKAQFEELMSDINSGINPVEALS
jgi:hypothetical protein